MTAHLASLGRGAKWFGGVVVVAVVGALTPVVISSLSPEEELSAHLDEPSIVDPVSLGEFATRQHNQFASFDGAATRMRLVAYAVVQTPVDQAASARDASVMADQGHASTPGGDTTTKVGGDTTTTPGGDTPSGGDTTKPSDGDTTTKPGGDTTTTPGDDTTTTPGDDTTKPSDGDTTKPSDGDTTKPSGGDGTTTPPGKRDVDAITVTPAISPDARDSLAVGVQAAARSSQLDLELPSPCEQNAASKGCGLSSMASVLGLPEHEGTVTSISTDDVEFRLARVFKGTRTEPSPDHPGGRELVGVAVSFDVAMIGFEGATVDIRWSLYGADGATVPRSWLRNQRALVLECKAKRNSGGGEFWVPIPQAKGSFFIRVGVYDQDGNQLDHSDSRQFS